jgi:hypothetical protein
MLEKNYALNLIMKGIEGTVKKAGLEVEYPEGIRPPELPVTTQGNKSIIMYRGETGRIRIVHEGEQLALHIATANESDAPDDDMPRKSLSLLDLETFDERDLKYIFEEYIETIEKSFNCKTATGKKLPTPVSRTQAKSGAIAYDANTLGDRFTKLYPELRDEYKRNIEMYDEFLAEDFFVNHGNAVFIAVVRENDKTKMRQLFKLLNDIYEDGTNDTQSLVAVTIIGVSISDNLDLLKNCEEYFSDTMREPVLEVISYLSKSKGAKLRLANPPIYKPQKQKKKGMFSSMLGM